MISLRTYNHQIEQLIDDGQYEEAIAHCRHILKNYPKYIEIYRVLGKALLEQKKYSDAKDIFNRVLSVFPDDFISHVGLSVICEDENNLDLSIWHMEQAFDSQPSNVAIQDELKRLFGLRDGESPVKIRLSRGALVRMYARGELFQQAITEILSILEQDQKRIDLQVLLAKMYYLSNNKLEASSVANQILVAQPHCFEMNRMLLDMATNNSEIDKAATLKDRLISLDPYFRFLQSAYDEQQISDSKIKIEKLDYKPGIIMDDEIPNWANTSTESNNDSTDLLTPQNQTQSNEIENDKIDQKSQLPEWMSQAGWTDGNSVNGQKVISNIDSSNQDIEVPGWLLEDQPEQELESSSKPDNQQIPPQDQSSHLSNSDLAELFSELKEGKMDLNFNDNSDDQNKSVQGSDWKSQFEKSDANNQTDSESNELPDWLKSFENDDSTSNTDAEFIPDWLKNLQSQVEPFSQQPSSGLPENESDSIFTESDKSVTEDGSFASDRQEGLLQNIDNGWKPIDSIAESDVSFENSDRSPDLDDDLDDDLDENILPDWVKTVLATNTESIPSNSTNPSETGPLSTFETPEAVVDNIAESQDIVGNEGAISNQTNDELLDWLRGLKTEETSVNQEEEKTISLENQSNNNLKNSNEDLITNDNQELFQFEDKISENNRLLGTEPEAIEKNTIPFDEKSIDEKSSLFVDSTNFTLDQDYSDQSNESIFSEPIQNTTGMITETINSRNFEKLPNICKKIIEDGVSLDQVIDCVKSFEKKFGQEMGYWQSLGDIFATQQLYDEAFSSYQKAEEILVNSISSN